MVKPKTVCAGNILFSRNDEGQQILTIDMLSSLEKLFRNEETETSEKYKDENGDGLEYYKLSEGLKKYTERYNQTRNGEGHRVTLQKYGTDLFTDDNLVANFSVLRSVDISGGVSIVTDDLILRDDCKQWIEELAAFMKFLYQNFVESVTVKARIEFEI